MAKESPVYLYRNTVTSFDECMLPTSDYKPLATSGLPEDSHRVLVKVNTLSEPGLLDVLSPFCDVSEIELNRRSSAVVLVKSENRFFAVCFGDGRHALAEYNLEHDFGVLLACLGIGGRSIREIGSRSGGMSPVVTRQRQSRPETWANLRLPGFGNSITYLDTRAEQGSLDSRRRGGVSAYWSNARGLNNLRGDLSAMLADYLAAGIDNAGIVWGGMRKVRASNPVLAACQATLLALLNDGVSHDVPMILPGRFISEVEQLGFTLHLGAREFDLSDLTWEAVTDAVSSECQWTWRKLTDCKVVIQLADGDVNVVSLLNILSYVIEDDLTSYLLVEGSWFELSDYWRQWIDNRLTPYIASDGAIALPVWDRNVSERQYNCLVGKMSGWQHWDRDNFVRGGSKAKLEVCDLVSPDGTLVHVKEYVDSASIGYVARQASGACVNLSHFQDLRKWFEDTERIKRGENVLMMGRTVAIGIGIDGLGSVLHTIPLNGKLALVEAVDTIRDEHFTPIICRIQRA